MNRSLMLRAVRVIAVIQVVFALDLRETASAYGDVMSGCGAKPNIIAIFTSLRHAAVPRSSNGYSVSSRYV